MTVSKQISDAVSQTDAEVVDQAPSLAMGALFQSMTFTSGQMFENSTLSEHHHNHLAQGATSQGVAQLNAVDAISDAIAVSSMLEVSDGISSDENP